MERYRIGVAGALVFLGCAIFCAGALSAPGEKTEKVGPFGILHHYAPSKIKPVTLRPDEQQKKEIAEKLDTHHLLYSAKAVTDEGPELLVPTDAVARWAGKDYVLAKTPPRIDFVIVPAEPLFLGASPVMSRTAESNDPGPWANWSQAIYDERTGKFYSSVGDHGKYDAHIYLVEYDPAARKIRCLPEVNAVLGRTAKQFGEGKIHGWLDFYKSANLSSPHLWFCTFFAKYPPDEDDYATGYEGGHIMSCDVMTGDIVDYGVPLVRESWPYHRVDTDRGILYAVGDNFEFLAWDMNTQRTKWAGYLPKGMCWEDRTILIDRITGMVYSSNNDSSDVMKHIIRYDPAKNTFKLLPCHMPVETRKGNRGAVIGGYDHMRAETRDRGPDGLFWGVSYDGLLFTFDPVKEEIVSKGYNWPGEQRYTCSIDRSPGGRYLYYLPGAHGRSYMESSSLIQYDTVAGTKKVLAFMYPYYYKKYGYLTGGTFSVKLDKKGEKLFVLWNGSFMEPHPETQAESFGQCSVMVITIPESERRE